MNPGEKIAVLRKQKHWSQEDLAGMLHVSRQAVSKWESGQSLPDLEKILALSDLFSVSTDLLLKNDLPIEPKTESPILPDADSIRLQPEKKPARPSMAPLTPASALESDGSADYEKSADPDASCQNPQEISLNLQQAKELLQRKKAQSVWTAAGVALCVLGAAALLLCIGAAGSGRFNLSMEAGCILGLCVLLCCAAAAVGIFILSGKSDAQSEKEKDGGMAYLPDAPARQWLLGCQTILLKKLPACSACGVILCILSVLPLLAGTFWGRDSGWIFHIGLCLMLCMIAAALPFFIIPQSIRTALGKILLEKEFEPKKRQEEEIKESVSRIYWLCACAVYLTWSFIGHAWGISWIVWPIAGICFSAIMSACTLALSKSRSRS